MYINENAWDSGEKILQNYHIATGDGQYLDTCIGDTFVSLSILNYHCLRVSNIDLFCFPVLPL